MGFWSWLFGKKSDVEEEDYKTKIDIKSSKDIKKEKGEFVGVKPKYKKVPRTKEMGDYIKSIIKKAESKDPEPRSHDESDVDREKAEKYVDKIQGRVK